MPRLGFEVHRGFTQSADVSASRGRPSQPSGLWTTLAFWALLGVSAVVLALLAQRIGAHESLRLLHPWR